MPSKFTKTPALRVSATQALAPSMPNSSAPVMSTPTSILSRSSSAATSAAIIPLALSTAPDEPPTSGGPAIATAPTRANPIQGATTPTGSGAATRNPRQASMPPAPIPSAARANTRPRSDSRCALLSEWATSQSRVDVPRHATMLFAVTMGSPDHPPPRAIHAATTATSASAATPPSVAVSP